MIRRLFLSVLGAVIFSTSLIAQEKTIVNDDFTAEYSTSTKRYNAPDKPCIKMHFANKAGSEFALLIMGTEEGEYSLDWGNGNIQKGELHTYATQIKGKTASQDLTIYGQIAVLECSYNGLTSLDVTKMSTLTHLTSRKNFVKKIDLSGNPNLKMVYIQDSPLEVLDLSNNPKVDSLIITNNKLENLILSSQSALEVLICTTNAKLKELNLTGCPKLRYLDAMQTMVTEYDLSKNKELSYVAIGLGRPITLLKLPADNKIDTLLLPMAGLKTLDLSQTKNLSVLATDNNFTLSSLDLSGMAKLKTLSCENNNLTALDLSDTKELTSLTCNNNQLKTLDVGGKTKLATLICYSNLLQKIDLTGCSSLKVLDCSMNKELSEVSFPATLTTLNCSGCNFTQLNISSLTKMSDLHCDNNKISSLDISQMKELTAINCGNNNISSLDFKNNSALLDVNISNNPIKTGILFSSADNLRYVSVNGTLLNACSLDNMYRSLREKRPEDDNNDIGGLLLFNDVAQNAKVSNTKIATDKGWIVSVVGDGSGCTENGMKDTEIHKAISIRETIDGWDITDIPTSAKALYLLTVDGRPIARYPIVSTSVSVKAPQKGLYIISLDNGKGIVCIKR